METQTQTQLIDEIRQLREQYLAEVPGRRSTWPKSIKERVLQLRQLELSYEKIAALTGIPAPTIYSWKSRLNPEPAFLPVKVVEEPARSPVVEAPATRKLASKRVRERSTPTIIVIAPNGVRLEGLDLKSALTVAREMASWT